MNVFLVGPPFLLSSIIYFNELYFAKPLTKVMLLADIRCDYYSINDIRICYSHNLRECIETCEATIILRSSTIPKRTIDEIKSISSDLGKAVYCFDVHQDSKNDLETVCNMPCVLHLFLGKASQQLSGESLLYSVFNDNHISFTNLNRGSAMSLWHNNTAECPIAIHSNIIDRDKNPDVLYVPLFIEEIIELRDYFEHIKKLKPDYLVVQTDCSYHNYDELCNATKYICNREMDVWIKSRYYLYEEKGILSFQKEITASPPAKDLYDISLKDTVSFDILSKMAFPSRIKKYL